MRLVFHNLYVLFSQTHVGRVMTTSTPKAKTMTTFTTAAAAVAPFTVRSLYRCDDPQHPQFGATGHADHDTGVTLQRAQDLAATYRGYGSGEDVVVVDSLGRTVTL